LFVDNVSEFWQDTIFDETYTIQSNSGVINLEVPIGALSRALRSAVGATSAQLRLTKKSSAPILALTVVTSSWTTGSNALGIEAADEAPPLRDQDDEHSTATQQLTATRGPRERETIVTQEIRVKVLHQSAIEGLHEPRCRDPDVHIILPGLAQLKAISDRFTKLAMSNATSGRPGGVTTSSATGPKLELSANMHGSLKLAIATDALRISSVWTGLVNPPLDPSQLSQTEIEQLPSERMRALGAEGNSDDEIGWAKVRIDGKDWGRVLSVGRLSPKVVACKSRDLSLYSPLPLPPH
jgi:HUS1 checkpoint protein